MDLFLINIQLFTSQDINWWTGVCGLLVDYCDVFISCLDSHYDGTHSLQRIHRWTSDAMLHFSKSVPMKRKCFPSSYTFFLFATDLFPAVQQPWQGEEDRGRGRPSCSKPHRMECPGGEQGGRGLDPFRYTRIIISLDTCIAFYRK